MSSKNTFDFRGDEIRISREGWDKTAVVTSNEEYNDTITNVTWTKKEDYLYNSKLGYLHRYVMKIWYGDTVIQEMDKKDYICKCIGQLVSVSELP